MWVSAYIHTNPAKDGFVKNLQDYKWSSYNDYALERNLPIIYKNLIVDLFEDKKNFKKQTFSLVSENKLSRGILDI